MPACPAGHDSSATDFCDVCGMRIDGAAAGSASEARGALPASGSASSSAASAGAGPAPAGATPAAPGEPCPQCGTERTGQFCEGCGFDFSTRTPAQKAAPAAATVSQQVPVATAIQTEPAAAVAGAAATSVWTAVVTADREYYD